MIGLIPALAAFAALVAFPAQAGAFIYWGDGNRIARANLDGTAVDTRFIALGGLPVDGLAVDARHIYWASGEDKVIGRANLDGTGVNRHFISVPNAPGDVAVDSGHIYWTTGDPSYGIGRANLDGSGVNPAFIPEGFRSGLAIDGGFIFWLYGPRVSRANLDGTGVNQDFIPCPGCIDSLAVGGGKVYWNQDDRDLSIEGIGRANADGSGFNARFISLDGRPGAIEVNATHIFWAGDSGNIARARIGGTEADLNFITDVSPAGDNALALDRGSIAPPAAGRSVLASVVSGIVKVKRRGQKGFRTLTGQASIPVGSEVDARKGRVRLESAAGGGESQSGEFYSGQFVLRQARGRAPVTELVLSEKLSCGRRARAAARRRGLWGDAKGRFRTRGKHAAATVRGTIWNTQDTCTTTTVRVTEGAVSVRDLVRKRTVTVRAGKSYTATAR